MAHTGILVFKVRMDTRRYAAFLAAAQTKSMSGAAKQLGYTPSGIVRLVNALEADIGFALLVRTSSGVSLTPEGEKLVPLLKEILRYEERVEQTSARIRGLAEGALSIGVQSEAAPPWISNVLSGYQHSYPDIELHVHERPKSEIVNMLENHEIDCCLMNGSHEGLVWTPLALREIVVWVPAGSELLRNTSILLAELGDVPIAKIESVDDSIPERLLDRPGVELDIRYELQSADAARSLVEAGAACCLSYADAPSSAGALFGVRPLSPRRYVEFGAAVNSNATMVPAAGEFLVFAEDFAKSIPTVERGE